MTNHQNRNAWRPEIIENSIPIEPLTSCDGRCGWAKAPVEIGQQPDGKFEGQYLSLGTKLDGLLREETPGTECSGLG